MKRIALWLMTAATGWMALRSLRAEGEAALVAAHAKGANLQKEHAATPGELAGEGRRPRPHRRPSCRDSAARLEGHSDPHLSQHLGSDGAGGGRHLFQLALFPGIVALVSVYGMIANPPTSARCW